MGAWANAGGAVRREVVYAQVGRSRSTWVRARLDALGGLTPKEAFKGLSARCGSPGAPQS